jgi:hypothetical protein
MRQLPVVVSEFGSTIVSGALGGTGTPNPLIRHIPELLKRYLSRVPSNVWADEVIRIDRLVSTLLGHLCCYCPKVFSWSLTLLNNNSACTRSTGLLRS